jgi:gas vesicle protein
MASSGDKLIYFMVGGFVGASVALLLAPRSGEETRDFLGSHYRDGSERIGETFRSGREAVVDRSKEFAERANETIGRGRDTLNRQKEQLAAAVEAGRQAYEEEKEELQDSEKNEAPPSDKGDAPQEAAKKEAKDKSAS